MGAAVREIITFKAQFVRIENETQNMGIRGFGT